MNKIAMGGQREDESRLEVMGIGKVFPEDMSAERIFEGGVELMK